MLITPCCDLFYDVSHEELMDEFFYYMDNKGKCSLFQTRNKIIKFFQQDNYFKTEKELWQDPKIANKLIINRCKYLFKNQEDLNVYDILSGFKKSAIHYGYSGFNPLLAKWFYEQYNIKTCYDPCGGWGHRLLGSVDLDLYIYNDFSRSTFEGVQNIVDYFDFPNVVLYNRDASSFVPQENFEAMFTCPPYYNLEHYECGDFKDRKSFDDFIDNLFKVFEQKESCKYFGLVIREDLIGEHNDYIDKIILEKNHAVHLNKQDNRLKEYLYIYSKTKE